MAQAALERETSKSDVPASGAASSASGAGEGGDGLVSHSAFDIKELMRAKGIYFGCPPAGEAPFVAAFGDYHTRMQVLRGVSVAEQQRILRSFNEAMLKPSMVDDVADPLAAVGVASLTAAELADHGPFAIDLGAAHLATFERDFPAGPLKDNMRTLMAVAFRALHQCGIRHHLCYHVCDHLVKMLHDCARLAKELELEDRALLSAVEGLFHDALFTFKRGVDELNSSKLLWTVLRPFVDTLSPSDQAIFEAIIMAGIPGGTVPVPVKLDLAADADAVTVKAAPMGWKPLGELYTECVPGADCESLGFMYKACLAMEGDVQQSATPVLDEGFPVRDRPELAGDNLLLSLVNTHVDHEYAHLSVADRAQRVHGILAKLAQSAWYLTENMKNFLPEEHHDQADITVDKFARAFRRRSTDGLEFDKADAVMLGRKIGGEKFFASMNLTALLGAEGSLRSLPLPGVARPYAIHPESWRDHIAIYTAIAEKLPAADADGDMTDEQAGMLTAFVENAIANGPGAYPDWARMPDVVAPARLVPVPAAATVAPEPPGTRAEQATGEGPAGGAAAPQHPALEADDAEAGDEAGAGDDAADDEGDGATYFGRFASALYCVFCCGCCSTATVAPGPGE